MTTPFWSRMGRRWCTIVHGKPMWPVHGHYRCSICLRTYPVRWGPEFVLAPAAFGRQGAKLAETAR